MRLSHDDVASFIETQLSVWPLAKRNYDALAAVERRSEVLGDYEIGIQFNPARIVSTGALTDKESIAARPCFLCRDNRPEEQMVIDIRPGWEMLVNPFPILPVHLTIVSSSHQPQNHVPDDIIPIAESLPGMAVFFNGARAGASAPDHLHLQAVLKDELPLVRFVERYHSPERNGVMTSAQFGLDLPYFFISGVVAPDKSGYPVIMAGLNTGGPDNDGNLSDPESVNSFFWIDETCRLRFLVVPRISHRPKCYYASGDSRRIISPGCIDMAGLLIVPREKDYRVITRDEIMNIYSDVALPSDVEYSLR